MRSRDISLVTFTILSQWSFGVVLCFTLLAHFQTDTGLFLLTGMSLKNPVVLALFMVLAATFVSFLHLGSPINAPHALRNLSGSWLSREILALGVYSLILSGVAVLTFKDSNPGHFKLGMSMTSVTGVVLIWMMIRVYRIPTIPAWNSWYTPLSFVSTAFCLGLLTLLLFHDFGWLTIAEPAGELLTVSLIVVLLAETGSGFLHQAQLEKMDTGIDDRVFDQGVYYRIFISRMVLLITALLLLAATEVFTEIPALVGHIYIIVVVIVTQECMGRLLFYSSYFRVGV